MPNIMPPSGRTAKPTPKVRNASSEPTTGSLLGKNNSPNTRAAAVPYRKKSYHSSAEPMLAARMTRRRERLALSAVMSVMVSPFCIYCRCLICRGRKPWQCARLWITRARSQNSGRAGKIGFLRRGLGFVDRSLPFRRRQRKAYGNIGHPRRDNRIAAQQAAVELVKILYAHQRPGVAGGDFIEQQVARPVRGVHGRAVQRPDVVERHAAGLAHAGHRALDFILDKV